MRRSLFFLVFGTLVLLGLFLLAPPPQQTPLADLPWQIQVFEDGSTRVLGVQLGRDPLEAVVARHGAPEGLALFVSAQGHRSLEAYFGTVRLGPLEGKLVARLSAPEADLVALQDRAIGTEASREGGRRLLLGDADKRAQTRRTVIGLTYIPSWSKMDAEFLAARLGPPARSERIDADTERWIYPDRGLSLLLDSAGPEVFEYASPGLPTPSR